MCSAIVRKGRMGNVSWLLGARILAELQVRGSENFQSAASECSRGALCCTTSSRGELSTIRLAGVSGVATLSARWLFASASELGLPLDARAAWYEPFPLSA